MQQIEETAAKAEDAIQAFVDARASYADRVKQEDKIEAERARAKSDAIARIMQTTNPLTGQPHSASSAEKVVETDEQYATYLFNKRSLVHEKLRHETAYKSAYLRAELQIALCRVALGVV